jgi:hypothetical protein
MNQASSSKLSEKNIEIKNIPILEKLTRSFLRKIRENESAEKKANLKSVFREQIEKEKF